MSRGIRYGDDGNRIEDVPLGAPIDFADPDDGGEDLRLYVCGVEVIDDDTVRCYFDA